MLAIAQARKNAKKNDCPVKAISLEILSLLLRHGNSLDQEGNFAHHLRKIEAHVAASKQIELVLPAFPAKSPNREKTIGNLPDLAEVLGLQRLQALCDTISSFYGPGAAVVICSDGRVFSDLVLVSDEEVSAYGKEIDSIIAELGLRSLRTFDMDQVFHGRDYDAMRLRLVQEHGRSLDAIREEVRSTFEAKSMFNGIHRFVFEDRVVLQPEKSRNKLREEGKGVAYEVIQRSNAWSGLVESLFPEAVRLSIHPQFSASSKLGFRLVDCENIWGTPWHNVACLGKNGFRLIKRKEAEALGAVLSFEQGKYAFFREVGV